MFLLRVCLKWLVQGRARGRARAFVTLARGQRAALFAAELGRTHLSPRRPPFAGPVDKSIIGALEGELTPWTLRSGALSSGGQRRSHEPLTVAAADAASAIGPFR